MNLYQKRTTKPYYYLVISDNALRFRKNLSKKIKKLIMTIDYNIRDEKREYDINREAAKISALSSGKIDKYEYLMDQEILPSNHRQIIEESKFANYPLRKTFEKQTKAIEDLGKNNSKL